MSSKCHPDNHLNAPFYCNIFPRTYVSMVPAGLGEDEGSCYWTLDQHIARIVESRSRLPHSPQMRRCGMSQKTTAAKPRFPDRVTGERAVWPWAPTEPHRCNASNKKYVQRCTAHKSCSHSCPAVILPRSLPAGESGPGDGARTGAPRGSLCCSPGPSN